jgi:hypothetical protein
VRLEMAEVLTVLFKIGRIPSMTKPAPSVIENALKRFLHETIAAKELAPELGISSDTQVRYEVKWVDELVEDPGKIPIHLSIRGPRSIAEPLHDKLKAGLAEGRWTINRDHFKEFAADLGIPHELPTEFKLYVRSPSGEKFDA